MQTTYNSVKVCEYSRSRSFHDDLILQDQASGERSQDQWSSGWHSYRLPRPTALIPGHVANQKVEIMSCDKMPNLRVVIQKNTETAFLKNRFLLLLKSYEMQVRFFGMLIDSRVHKYLLFWPFRK